MEVSFKKHFTWRRKQLTLKVLRQMLSTGTDLALRVALPP